MPADKLNSLTVGEIMNRWPETIGVFLSLNMRCVGCPVAMLHHVEDAAEAHSVSEKTLCDAIKHVVLPDDIKDVRTLCHPQ